MEEAKRVFQEMAFKKSFGIFDPAGLVQGVTMEAEENGTFISDSESIGEDSGNNNSAISASFSSSELADDASSSPTSSPSSSPLNELSELMNELPIKRGLSKHYQGKSQSFTSLANVESLEDLAKKVSPYSQRMKSCKSYAGLLNHKFGPKAVIAKKSSLRGMGSSFLSSLGSRGSFVASCRHPISLQKDC